MALWDVGFKKNITIRDIIVSVADVPMGQKVVEALNRIKGANVLQVTDRTFMVHQGGKIEIKNKIPLNSREDLSMAYTPGVARICMAIHEKRERAYELTIKKNTIAVVTDGTAVLGLGDIGPEAAMPVMEGKAMLFKEFGGVDAFPICLKTKDPRQIVTVVKSISPGFGGVNLEDIASPRCFEIERRLRNELDIPVFHDDQHGTAVVVLADDQRLEVRQQEIGKYPGGGLRFGPQPELLHYGFSFYRSEGNYRMRPKWHSL